MDKSREFWDRQARRFGARAVADAAAFHQALEATRAHLHAGMDVLEIGCGTGTTALAHAPHVRTMLAIDYSAAMIDIAKARAERRDQRNLRFDCLGMDELGPEPRFDAVLMFDVLHLLPSPDAAVARVHGLLRPGGRFIGSTACLSGPMAWLTYVSALGSRLGLMPRVSAFSEKQLRASLAAKGFVLDACRRAPGQPSVFLVARKPGPGAPSGA